jgi:hypothetical protein
LRGKVTLGTFESKAVSRDASPLADGALLENDSNASLHIASHLAPKSTTQLPLSISSAYLSMLLRAAWSTPRTTLSHCAAYASAGVSPPRKVTQRDREVPASGAADSADPLTAASAKNETFQDMVPDLPTTTNLLQPLTFFLNKSLDDSRFLINEDIIRVL